MASNFTPHFVYRCYDASGKLLYVGCTAMTIARRSADHRSARWWFTKVVKITKRRFPSKAEALLAEAIAIQRDKPQYNVNKTNRVLPRKIKFQELRAKRWSLQRIGANETPPVSRQYVWEVLNDGQFSNQFRKGKPVFDIYSYVYSRLQDTNISLGEIVKSTGVPSSTVRWVKDAKTANPRIKTLQKLAAFFEKREADAAQVTAEVMARLAEKQPVAGAKAKK